MGLLSEQAIGASASLDDVYLTRCQHNTPPSINRLLWEQIKGRRPEIRSVLDLGAGDGRLCPPPDVEFERYLGVEIDPARSHEAVLPANAQIQNSCAFEDAEQAAYDVVIGNPPYVRNQDLPEGWARDKSTVLRRWLPELTEISGLANAWQYFFWLALARATSDGLIALIIPYEWVSRPSAAQLRSYIKSKKWEVEVTRLDDATFNGVLTTASITLIDCRARTGAWKFKTYADQRYLELASETFHVSGPLPYASRISLSNARVRRGMSPGSQQIFLLSEGDRCRLGMEIGLDVLPAVNTLKPVPYELRDIGVDEFNQYYVSAGRKCWLINAGRFRESRAVRDYLLSIPEDRRDSATCRKRGEEWWNYLIPEPPQLLVAQSFKAAKVPKQVTNSVKAIAVGGVAGIFVDQVRVTDVLDCFDGVDLRERLVPYANGLYKVEIRQIQTLLNQVLESA